VGASDRSLSPRGSNLRLRMAFPFSAPGAAQHPARPAMGRACPCQPHAGDSDTAARAPRTHSQDRAPDVPSSASPRGSVAQGPPMSSVFQLYKAGEKKKLQLWRERLAGGAGDPAPWLCQPSGPGSLRALLQPPSLRTPRPHPLTRGRERERPTATPTAKLAKKSLVFPKTDTRAAGRQLPALLLLLRPSAASDGAARPSPPCPVTRPPGHRASPQPPPASQASPPPAREEGSALCPRLPSLKRTPTCARRALRK